MLIVLGSVLARTDSVEEIRRIAQEHVARSRLEPGCLSHAVHADLDEPLRLVFIERWADWDALRIGAFGMGREPAQRGCRGQQEVAAVHRVAASAIGLALAS
jgi:hypothetical protein